MNKKVLYTSDELLEIFKEQHRLCSPLDPLADESFMLSRESKISEWRDAQDLKEWEGLADFLNQEFRVNKPLREWYFVLNPGEVQTIGDLCDFLSTIAEKEIVQPVKRFGAECLTAAMFLTLKRNLKNKGVDVSNLRPSTLVGPFLEKNYSPLLEEVTLTGVKVFDKLQWGQLDTDSRFKYWVDRLLPNMIFRQPIDTGDIQTFRDLVVRIVDDERLDNASEQTK